MSTYGMRGPWMEELGVLNATAQVAQCFPHCKKWPSDFQEVTQGWEASSAGLQWVHAVALCREAGLEPLVIVWGGGFPGLPQVGGSPHPSPQWLIAGVEGWGRPIGARPNQGQRPRGFRMPVRGPVPQTPELPTKEGRLPQTGHRPGVQGRWL